MKKLLLFVYLVNGNFFVFYYSIVLSLFSYMKFVSDLYCSKERDSEISEETRQRRVRWIWWGHIYFYDFWETRANCRMV